jgi:ankyrin repeat protein
MLVVIVTWGVLKFLIDNGADVSAVDENGDTPLQLLNGEKQVEIEEYVSSINLNVKPTKR